jgi:hypothetical protein
MNALPDQKTFSQGLGFGPAPRSSTRLVAETNEDTRKVSRKFPRRPNLRVLSETIPLFYICQNRHGFWLARDAEGRSGGLFLRRQSALAFARRQSGAAGCAIMQLGEPAELDIENQGSRIAAALGTVIGLATRRAPLLVTFIGMVIAEWHKLVAQLSAALASGRAHRAAAERELFHGHYWLSAKGDDDLPIV